MILEDNDMNVFRILIENEYSCRDKLIRRNLTAQFFSSSVLVKVNSEMVNKFNANTTAANDENEQFQGRRKIFEWKRFRYTNKYYKKQGNEVVKWKGAQVEFHSQYMYILNGMVCSLTYFLLPSLKFERFLVVN